MSFVTVILLIMAMGIASITCNTSDSEILQYVSMPMIYQDRSEFKIFFAVLEKTDWLQGIDYCNSFGAMPGRISTQSQYTTITNFLQTTTQLPDGYKSLWLPATDHVEEGTFRWLENYEEVLVGNWSAGTPSRNRSVNCLALNQDGFYVEESCTSWDIRYHTLCELPMFRWGKEEGGRTNGVEILSKFQGIPSIQSLVEIGGVGNKRYFVDENPPEEGRLWTGSWDFCHEHDLRMAAPESMEELYFLTNYSKQENDAS